MFPNWRIKLREAKVAFREGRLDEAGDLLHDEKLTEFLQGKQLSAKVAAGIVERARRRMDVGETSAGWGDLARAIDLGGDEKTIDQIRDELISRGLKEAIDYLVAGDPHAALSRLAKIESRRPLSVTGRQLKEIAEHADQAKQFSERGHFADAAKKLKTAAALAGTEDTMELKAALERCCAEMPARAEEMRDLSDRLFEQVEAENWQSVLATAESILEIAPKNTAAQQARRRAWKAIGMDVTRMHVGRSGKRDDVIALRQRHATRSTRPGAASAKGDTVAEHQCDKRWLLWVDAVGGYLVCQGDALVLGQPSAHAAVDVPILADLSRNHAVIRRDGGSYVFEPLHRASVDDRPVEGQVVLGDGQVITLGDGVKMRFRKPHVLSATARLDFESNHKTQPSADGIILLADSCILGPKPHAHIVCRDWTDDVVLFRRGDNLSCRATGPFQIDGDVITGQGDIGPGSQVEGEEFSFSIETVE